MLKKRELKALHRWSTIEVKSSDSRLEHDRIVYTHSKHTDGRVMKTNELFSTGRDFTITL